MNFDKIAIWNDPKTAMKVAASGFDLILYEKEELQKLADGTLEFYEVFDKNHKPLCVASRKAVVKLNLICEAAHIYIFNKRGELLLQKRAASKDTYPNCYAPSAAGRINFGETVEHGAQRELKEELGLSVPLKKLGVTKCFTTLSSEFDHVFVGMTSKKPKPNDEIKSLNYFGLESALKFRRKEVVPALPLELKTFLPEIKKFVVNAKKHIKAPNRQST